MVGRLSAKRASSSEAGFSEDTNPMDGVSNLADVMLVMAVGIMLALVMHWNLDISPASGAVDMTQAEEVENMDDLNEEDLKNMISENGLEEKGKLYYDPETGKTYMIVTE